MLAFQPVEGNQGRTNEWVGSGKQPNWEKNVV